MTDERISQTLRRLEEKILSRSASIAVIGMGYVGLPLACLIASKNFRVQGIERRPERVAMINSGRSPIEGNEPGLATLLADVVSGGRLHAGSDYEDLRGAEVVFVAVETPVDEVDHLPAFQALESACRDIARRLSRGTLIIIESTIAPGTMRRVVRPILEEGSGLRADNEFFLGHCPERLMPGKLLANLRSMHRICGGGTPKTAEVMVSLYKQFVDGDLDVGDCVTAEIVKTAENAFRDVNIAFANELALVCEASGADFWHVRELVNKSPGRNVLFAGPGVGGHCIPKDPWLLASGLPPGTQLNLIPAARMVNDDMPAHIVALAEIGLRRAGRTLSGSRLAVMGFAYLENSDDSRNSPSAAVVSRLQEANAEVIVQDPFVRGHQRRMENALDGADCAIFLVAHAGYLTLDLVAMRQRLRTPVLIDGRNLFNARDAHLAGLIYLGIGRGEQPA